jgi:hypothetical protein
LKARRQAVRSNGLVTEAGWPAYWLASGSTTVAIRR